MSIRVNQRYGHSIRMVTLLIVCSLLVGSLVAIAPVSASEDDWETKTTDRFVLEYQPGYADDATYIGEVAENAYTELKETLPADVEDLDFAHPVHIRVYPGELWSQDDWTLYWVDSEPVTINVQAEADSEAGEDWYDSGLAHELANMFLWNEAGQYDVYPYYDRNPSWFHQGLSEYYIYQTPTVST